ncbi:MAG: DUF637 domain-containing protein [Burkholderiales bacterium]|nr:DUF637 domain-containing protein [Burkholderiales bacterium]
MASTGNIAITSGQNSTASQYTADAHAESHRSTTTQASTLAGETVTVHGDNVTLSASDISATGAVRVTAVKDLHLGYTEDSQSDYAITHRSSGGWLNSSKSVDETRVTDTRARTTHVSASRIDITAGGNADLYAPELRVIGQHRKHTDDNTTGKAHVSAGGQLSVYALQGEHRVDERHESSSAWLGGMLTYNRDNSADTRITPKTLVAKLIAPEELHLQSGGNMRLQAPEFDSSNTIFEWGTGTRIDEKTGKPIGEGAQLLFEGVKETTLSAHQSTRANLLWQKQTSSVTEDETLRVAHFTHPDGVQLIPGSKAGSVVVDTATVPHGSTPTSAQQQAIDASNTLLATLQGASARTGTSTGTGTAPTIEQRAIELTHSHVEKTQEGLTPEGTALVAIAVAVATANPAGATAAGGSGAMGAMASAGYSALATQATISLINNQGDLGKTLEQLGSENNLKSLATTMLTAGALQGLGGQIKLDVPDANGATLATRINDIKAAHGFGANLSKNLLNATASAGVNTAINGGNFADNLGASLGHGLIDTVAQQGANAIGNAASGQNDQPPTLDSTGQTLAHLGLGCAVGSASAGSVNGCAPGAIGAVAGEKTAEYAKTHNMSDADALALAKVIAGTSGLLAGGMDNAGAVNIAAMTGGNAAENNYLNHAEILRKQKLQRDIAACAGKTDCAAPLQAELNQINTLDKERDAALAGACKDTPSTACTGAKQEVRNFAADIILNGSKDVLLGADGKHTLTQATGTFDQGKLLFKTASGTVVSVVDGYTETFKSLWEFAKAPIETADKLGTQAKVAAQDAKEALEWIANNPIKYREIAQATETRLRSDLATAMANGDEAAIGATLGAVLANFSPDPLKKVSAVNKVIDEVKLAKKAEEARGNGANGGTAVVDGLAFRADLPSHMIGPDGFTKSGQLSGTHNLANATSALDTKGATYTLNPTGTTGVYELPYSYTNPATGKVVSGSKTVYDPAVFSDQTMINNAQQAGQQAWTQYLQNPTVKVIDGSVGGVNFRSYINVDKNGNAFIGNVHPIK